MRELALVLAIACCFSYTSAIAVTDCNKPDSIGKLTKVVLTGCSDEDEICPLKRGTNVSINIEFETSGEVKQLHQEVHGIVRGLAVPFKLPSDDACLDTGLTCPMPAGTNKYEYGLFVKRSYPPLKVGVRWQLKDPETKNDVVCIEIPAQIR